MSSCVPIFSDLLVSAGNYILCPGKFQGNILYPAPLQTRSRSVSPAADTNLIHRLRLGFAKYRRLHRVYIWYPFFLSVLSISVFALILFFILYAKSLITFSEKALQEFFSHKAFFIYTLLFCFLSVFSVLTFSFSCLRFISAFSFLPFC